MISYRNISISFDDTIFDKAEIQIPDTGFLALTGESGCGKTTLLKDIFHHIGHLSDDFTSDLKKDDIVYCDQFATIDPQLTIDSFLSLLCEIYHRDRDDENILYYLRLLHIDDLPMDHTISQLSVGQRKRLYLAGALSLHTKCLLIDEPTSSIDYTLKKDLFNVLKEVSKDCCVFMTTHETDFQDMFDDIYHIDNKKIHLVKGQEISLDIQGIDKVDGDYHYRKISSYIGTKTKKSLLLLFILIVFIFNVISFQQVLMIKINEGQNNLVNTFAQRKMYIGFSPILRDDMPYDFPYETDMDLGGKVNQESLDKIEELDHVVKVVPFYTAYTRDYVTFYKDVDETTSYYKVTVNGKMKTDVNLTRQGEPFFDIVSYDSEDGITHDSKKIKGTWINPMCAKLLGITESDIKKGVMVETQVGLPSYIQRLDNEITYYENGEMQDKKWHVQTYDVIFDKKTIKFKIDGILRDDEYSEFFVADAYQFIYMDNEIFSKIIQDNLPKTLRKRKQYKEYKEKDIDYVPYTYNVYVDDLKNFNKVSHQIEEIDPHIMIYVPTNETQGWVDRVNSDFKTHLIQNVVYIVLGMIAMIFALYRYHTSSSSRVKFLRNSGLELPDIRKVLKFDVFKITIPFIIVNVFICYLRKDGAFTAGYFFVTPITWLLKMFIIFSIGIAVLFNIIDWIIIRRTIHD